MDVNDDAFQQGKRGAYGFIASSLLQGAVVFGCAFAVDLAIRLAREAVAASTAKRIPPIQSQREQHHPPGCAIEALSGAGFVLLVPAIFKLKVELVKVVVQFVD